MMSASSVTQVATTNMEESTTTQVATTPSEARTTLFAAEAASAIPLDAAVLAGPRQQRLRPDHEDMARAGKPYGTVRVFDEMSVRAVVDILLTICALDPPRVPDRRSATLHVYAEPAGRDFEINWEQSTPVDHDLARCFEHDPVRTSPVCASSSSSSSWKQVAAGLNGTTYRGVCKQLPVLVKRTHTELADNPLVEWMNGRCANVLREQFPIFPVTYQIMREDAASSSSASSSSASSSSASASSSSASASSSSASPFGAGAQEVPTLDALVDIALTRPTSLVIMSQALPEGAVNLLALWKRMVQFGADPATVDAARQLRREIMPIVYYLMWCMQHLSAEFKHNDLHLNNVLLLPLDHPMLVCMHDDQIGATRQVHLSMYPVLIDFGRSVVNLDPARVQRAAFSSVLLNSSDVYDRVRNRFEELNLGRSFTHKAAAATGFSMPFFSSRSAVTHFMQEHHIRELVLGPNDSVGRAMEHMLRTLPLEHLDSRLDDQLSSVGIMKQAASASSTLHSLANLSIEQLVTPVRRAASGSVRKMVMQQLAEPDPPVKMSKPSQRSSKANGEHQR